MTRLNPKAKAKIHGQQIKCNLSKGSLHIVQAATEHKQKPKNFISPRAKAVRKSSPNG